MPSHSKKHRRTAPRLLEALEPRQLAAIDLVVADFEIDQQTAPLRPRADRHLTGQIIVQNGGATKSTNSFTVGIVLEDSPSSPAASRKVLSVQTVTTPLALGATATLAFDITLPDAAPGFDVDDNDMYLSAHVDFGQQITESNEANNHYRGENVDYYRFRADENLTVLPGAGGDKNVVPYQAFEFFPSQGRIGDEVSGTTDMDVHSLDVTGGRMLEIGLRDTDFNSAIRVYDSNWNLLASNDQRPGDTHPNDPWVLIPTGGGGKRYVVVSSTQNYQSDPFSLVGRFSGETGQYTLYEKVYTTPTVTVGPTTSATIYESSGDASTASFFVERTGSTDHALVVPFNVSGPAGINSDVIAPTAVTILPGQTRASVTVTAISDTVIEPAEYINFEIKDFQAEYWPSSPRSFTMIVRENPQLVGPRATNGAFLFDDLAGPRLYVQFDDQIRNYDAGDFVVTNRATGQRFLQTRAIASPNGDTAILYFDAPLPDGNYRATFVANAITNPQGGWNKEAYSFDFFSLRGDANHDRAVGFDDLVTLSQNYGRTSGVSYHNGDFNYDGTVNFDDLVILSQQYGKQLQTPPSIAAVIARPTESKKKSRYGDQPIV